MKLLHTLISWFRLHVLVRVRLIEDNKLQARFHARIAELKRKSTYKKEVK